MKKKVYEGGGIEILEESGNFVVRYDAGAHQIALREDTITKEEASMMMADFDQATKILFAIQKRLEKAGVDPYVSNIQE